MNFLFALIELFEQKEKEEERYVESDLFQNVKC